MQIRTIEAGTGDNFVLASMPEFIDWKEQSETLKFMSANRGTTFNLTGGEEPVRVSGTRVTTDYFSVFAVEPRMGRAFRVGEDEPGTEPVVMKQHQFLLAPRLRLARPVRANHQTSATGC